MVEPITIMAGIAAAGTIAQLINSERGRRMARSERRRLEQLAQKLESPQFDTTELTVPELKLLEEYTPEVADLIYEVEPKLLEGQSQRAQLGKRAQETALSRLESIAGGQDELGDLAIIKAINDAVEASGRQREGLLANLARQGVSPSSSAYSQLQFQQQGASQKNMFDAALDAAIAERSRRDQAIGRSADLGGTILGSEMDLERYNTGLINRINERNTQARRQYLANRANAMNEAQRYNLAQRQKLYETNLMNQFEQKSKARDLRNKQAEADYRAQVQRISGAQSKQPLITEEIQGQNQAIQGMGNAALLYAMLNKQQQPTQPAQQEAPSLGYDGYPNYIEPTEEMPWG